MYKDISDNNKSKFSNRNTTSKTNKIYTYLGTCWKWNEFVHVAKECKYHPSNTKLNDQQEKKTMINTYRNTHNTPPVPPIKYPITFSHTKSPILTQQITVHFQLSQQAWKQLSNQMNKMVETNKLLKRQSR